MKAERSRYQRARSVTQTVASARRARLDLVRLIDLVEARTRVELIDRDGVEVPDRVRLTHDERIDNLRYALVWLQNAEQEIRLLRTQVERMTEYELKEVIR